MRFLKRKNILLSVLRDGTKVLLLGIKDTEYPALLDLVKQAKSGNKIAGTTILSTYGIPLSHIELIGDSEDFSAMSIEKYLSYQKVSRNVSPTGIEYLCYAQGRFGTPGVSIHDDSKCCLTCIFESMGQPKYAMLIKTNNEVIANLGLEPVVPNNPKLETCIYETKINF